VHRLGVSAGFLSEPADGFAVHLRQPRRLSNAATFAEVFQNRQSRFNWKPGAKQRGAAAFAEALLADLAAEQSPVILAIAITHVEIVGIAFAVQMTDRIQTTEV
jgi:hypothetical protein